MNPPLNRWMIIAYAFLSLGFLGAGIAALAAGDAFGWAWVAIGVGFGLLSLAWALKRKRTGQ